MERELLKSLGLKYYGLLNLLRLEFHFLLGLLAVSAPDKHCLGPSPYLALSE